MLVQKILDAINVIMAFQLTFFAIFLYFHKPHQLHKVYLAIFLSSKALVYYSVILVYSFHVNKVLIDFAYSFMFLLNPVTFLYTKFLMDRNHKFEPKTLIHAIPFLLVFSLAILSYHKINIKTDKTVILLIAFLFQVLIYIPRSLVLTMKQDNPKEIIEQEKIRVRWLKNLLYSLLLLWLVYAGLGIYNSFTSINSYGIVLFIELFFLIILLGLIYVALFNGKLIQFDIRKNKYYYSKFSDIEKTDILMKLEQEMTCNRIYLDSELTLERLANVLNISTRVLSQAINKYKAMNFNQYINSYRLQHSINLLANCKQKTIQEIVFESGFNSSSIFYDLFLKHTGTTPKQYRKRTFIRCISL
jgi:AraC-like DNA-binding protein